jgi:hypothetical protein
MMRGFRPRSGMKHLWAMGIVVGVGSSYYTFHQLELDKVIALPVAAVPAPEVATTKAQPAAK